ncbi:MAG: tetratricopeptide repeat protein [Gemmatimonadota bacterium]|nr:tetratricopeptide repeat protein [Gemmatimonadota bacterium]
MAIEGPLRELGIHDVFQLLDLSRKTGALRVTSELRDDEGDVLFDSGRVIHASIRSNPTSIERILRQAGKIGDAEMTAAAAVVGGAGLGDRLVLARVITQRELERQLQMAIENVIFELMSWREGFFSFEERKVADVPVDARIRISTESLLMEGARRIDEWSRIADKVPSLGVVPSLAPEEEDRASVLDLLPHEWEVLMMIDGERDLRRIAASLGSSEFEVAKIAYGLVSTGVILLRVPERSATHSIAALTESTEAMASAQAALDGGRADDALREARAAVLNGTDATAARLLVAKALLRLARHQEAVAELRRAVQADPITPEVHRELGFAAVRVGDFANARASWEHFLRLCPTSPDVGRIREGLDALTRMEHMLEAHANV